jgi:hypothetical protein
MICAISAVYLHRRGVATQPPYDFFLTAQDYLDRLPLLGTMESVENLLLFARFGIYYHINTSIWEIARICIRTCVELELHINPRKPLSALVEQHRRRIFWECYILDRHSSPTLGRPFAITDSDITVALPAPITEHQASCLSTGELSSIGGTGIDNDDITVFVFIIRLRQITSRIQRAFYANTNGTKHPSPRPTFTEIGGLWARTYELLDELQDWRQSAPFFDHVTSLYHRQEYYDFLYE